jgi:hypothetical protein
MRRTGLQSTNGKLDTGVRRPVGSAEDVGELVLDAPRDGRNSMSAYEAYEAYRAASEALRVTREAYEAAYDAYCDARDADAA